MDISALADMDANDTAEFKIQQDGGSTSSTYDRGTGSNGFSGYLVA